MLILKLDKFVFSIKKVSSHDKKFKEFDLYLLYRKQWQIMKIDDFWNKKKTFFFYENSQKNVSNFFFSFRWDSSILKNKILIIEIVQSFKENITLFGKMTRVQCIFFQYFFIIFKKIWTDVHSNLLLVYFTFVSMIREELCVCCTPNLFFFNTFTVLEL